MSRLQIGGTERPDFIAPARPPNTYLGIAELLMPGLDALASSKSTVGVPLAFLAAHTLECLLKAYISTAAGSDAKVRKGRIKHDLHELWKLAVSKGLPVSASIPAWAENLSQLHGPPYFLRYSTGVHGLVTPAAQPMVSDLKALLEMVRQRVR